MGPQPVCRIARRAGIEPEERTILAPGCLGCGRGRIFHPSFGQYPPAVPNTVLKIEQAEASGFTEDTAEQILAEAKARLHG